MKDNLTYFVSRTLPALVVVIPLMFFVYMAGASWGADSADAGGQAQVQSTSPHQYNSDAVAEVNDFLAGIDRDCVLSVNFEFGNGSWIGFVARKC